MTADCYFAAISIYCSKSSSLASQIGGYLITEAFLVYYSGMEWDLFNPACAVLPCLLLIKKWMSDCQTCGVSQSLVI